MEELARRGVPETPREALAALESRWGAEPALEAEVVAWLGSSGDADSAVRLHALEGRTEDRHVKREIKRALYRLAQRGLWSEPESPPPPSARDLLGPTEEEPEAWLTPIDATGTRLLWLARRVGETVASLSAVVSDLVGILEVHAGETHRKALRKAHQDLAVRSGIALVPAPWPHVDALLERAWRATADPSRFPDLPRARRVLVPRPVEPERVPPPVDALLDRRALADDPEFLARSGDSLSEPELATWLLPLEWLAPALESVEGARTSLVVVSPAQQEERVREAIGRSVEEIFATPGRREVFRSRFEETAYLLARRGRTEAARGVLAAAIAIGAGRPVDEVPLLGHIARRSLGLALETREQKAREEAKTSLVVTPAQALAEQRSRARRP